MLNVIVIFGKPYKKYDEKYYVSADGDVYSRYSNKLLKHAITADGHHRVDLHGKHVLVHRLVYIVWIGNIPKGFQINHKDDNKDNNNIANLYAGTQKQNIEDCIRNGNRVGNQKTTQIYDKYTDTIHVFHGTKEFLTYDGKHTAANLSLKRISSRNWFKSRYIIIE